jgi:hypothetical protein
MELGGLSELELSSMLRALSLPCEGGRQMREERLASRLCGRQQQQPRAHADEEIDEAAAKARERGGDDQAVVAEDELSYISALDDDSQLSQLSGVGLLDTSAELASLATDGEALSFEMALREWQVPIAPLPSHCATSSSGTSVRVYLQLNLTVRARFGCGERP